VQTNIVIFAVPDAAAFTAALAADDVVMSHFGPTRVRAVTHLDVDDAGIDRALAVSAQALQ
jgi:threonine aldolase